MKELGKLEKKPGCLGVHEALPEIGAISVTGRKLI